MPEPAVAAHDHPLAQAVAAVARGHDPETELTLVLELAVVGVGATGGVAFVWDSAEGRLAAAGAVGHDQETLTGLAEAVASDPDHPVHRVATGQRPDLGIRLETPAGVLAVAGLPLRISRGGIDEPIGALVISAPEPWTPDDGDATLLGAFANLVAVALDRARLAAMAEERGDWQERLAHTDALTGLANARTVSRVLELEVVRSGRQATELSVIVVDVDGLAAVNERAGAAAGDAILREVAAVIAESVRLVDTVARWGGDEFLVVAPGSAGATVADRIVGAITRRLAGSAGPGTTVSAGVARFPGHGATGEELVASASAALSAAKSAGPGSVAEA